MNKRVVLAIVFVLTVGVSLPADGAAAGLPMAAYIKIGDLTGGPGSDRNYPDYTAVMSVMVNQTRVDTCADAERLDNDPIGMITVQIAITKGYMDEASPGLHKRAESGDPIKEAVLAIDQGGRRCAVAFGKLSQLTVTRRGDVEEVKLRFEEIKVTMG